MSNEVSLIHALMSRRSIRAFVSTPVDEAALRQIFECARRAPSGSNPQPENTPVSKREDVDDFVRFVR